ncbi:hypothetical protein ACFLV5_01865 [Chloroflexota bacterium]
MSGKSSKSKGKDKSPKPEELQPQAQDIATPVPEPEQSQEPEPTPEPETIQEVQPTPTLESLYQEILTLKQIALEHSGMIVQLQQAIARKRKPVASNGKVQIRDKQTNTIYPSKNNCYQTLLKAGELKDLIDKDLFGPVPEKNTFGWYSLTREWPDRFEEVPEAQNSA